MKKHSDPFDTMFECMEIILDAAYADSDITDDELNLAKRRFRSALFYIIRTSMEDFQNETHRKLDS